MYQEKGSSASSFWLFLIGLGSVTKIYLYGCVALSELVVFFVAPLVFLRVQCEMKRLGFMQFLYMGLATMVAMFASSWRNGTAFPYVFKSFASMYAVMAYFVVFYALMRRNLRRGLGWLFLGAAISGVITIFALNPTAQVTESGSGFIGQAEVDDIVNGQLFWVQKLKDFGQLPIVAAYLQLPLAYSLFMPIAFTVFAMVTTISGRSASLSVLLFATMVFVGRKSRRTMLLIGRHLVLFALVGLSVAFTYNAVYKYAALQGLLGDNARRKYEAQTQGGKGGILSLLMSGRKEFFIAIPAALDKPIFGHGPFASDTEGYAPRFISKFGDREDVDAYNFYYARARMCGFTLQIPTHSHLMGGWVHYGIMGFIFWGWVLYLIYQHLRYYASAIPQWYGYFCLFISSYLWHIFFSPFGSRWTFAIFAVCLFFARAVGQGRMMLPLEMEMEARKHD